MIVIKKMKKAAIIGGTLGVVSGVIFNLMSSNLAMKKKMMRAGKNFMKKSYGILKNNRVLRSVGVRI